MLAPEYTVDQEGVSLSAARPVQLSRVQIVSTRVRPHDHDYCEIIIVTGGSMTHVVDGSRSRFERGVLAVLTPGQVHALEDCAELEVINIYYLPEWLVVGGIDDLVLRRVFVDSALTHCRIPPFCLDGEALAAVMQEADDLETELRREFPSRAYLRASLIKTMAEIVRAPRANGDAPGLDTAERGAGPAYGTRLESLAVVEHLDRLAFSGEAFSLDGLSGRFPITLDHLGRLFRRDTGKSPREYFIRRRAFEAAARLLHSDASITEIATDLGYADTAHLSRSFASEFGTSPRGYRRRYGWDDPR